MTSPTQPDLHQHWASPLQETSPSTSDLDPSRTIASSPAQTSKQTLWPREWKAYLSLAGCFFLMFNSWGLINSYGTFASYYKDELLPSGDPLLFNLVGSTQCFFLLSFSGVVGRLFDADHCRQLIGAGTILITAGMLLLSVVNGDGGIGQGNIGLIWLTQGLIVGVGMACFFVPSSAIAATWFKRRKMMAIGIVASGASISGLIYPVMLKYLIAQMGFNNAVRYVTVVISATSIFSFFTARPNPEHEFRNINWTNKREWVDTHARHNTSYVWFVVSVFMFFLGFYAVFFNLEEWALHRGVGLRDVPDGRETSLEPGRKVAPNAIYTFWLLSIMNASSSVGRIGSAYLSEHFGTVNVHAAATTIASILVLTLWVLARTVPTALAFVVLFGVFSGTVIGLPPASVAWIIENTNGNLSNLGQWTGMLYTIAALPALVGPVIAGHLIDEHGNYYTVQCWSGSCLLFSGLCMWLSRYYSSREILRSRNMLRNADPETVMMSSATTNTKSDTEGEERKAA